jgi:hypothetical protein
MLKVSTRIGTSTRAGRITGIMAIAAAAIVGVACSGSPAGPGVLSSDRRVQDGGGGGTLCTVGTCPGFAGRVQITAGGGSLAGDTTGVNEGSQTVFRFTSRPTGTGRFTEGLIDLHVDGDSALVNNLWVTNGKQVFQDKGKTVPATVAVGEKCTLDRGDPGVLVQTTIEATFENLGNTTIVEQHCVAP